VSGRRCPNLLIGSPPGVDGAVEGLGGPAKTASTDRANSVLEPPDPEIRRTHLFGAVYDHIALLSRVEYSTSLICRIRLSVVEAFAINQFE
jgi:hypothetical protein